MRVIAQRLALLGFLIYLAVFPGSTITVALGRVPAWGIWFGGALLLLQGAVMLLWLAGQRGGRGLLAGLLVAALGFAIEYIGVTTGLPFGRYVYTDVLQPQMLGVVPLAITCAWVMTALSSYEIAARLATQRRTRMLLTATLILLLDLQIETVATRVNSYWIWQTAGLYYDVPLSNFVGWWLTGLGMAWVLDGLKNQEQRTGEQQNQEQRIENKEQRSHIFLIAVEAKKQQKDVLKHQVSNIKHPSSIVYRLSSILYHRIPTLLYLLSTLMFTVVNVAYGYGIAGTVGMLVLAGAGARAIRQRSGAAPAASSQHRTLG